MKRETQLWISFNDSSVRKGIPYEEGLLESIPAHKIFVHKTNDNGGINWNDPHANDTFIKEFYKVDESELKGMLKGVHVIELGINRFWSLNSLITSFEAD